MFWTNTYFVTQKVNAYDYITRGILWLLIVQLELDANILRYLNHIIVLFNIDNDIFQVHTSHKSGVQKKKFDEYLNWLKKYAHVVNNRVLIDLIYTFLHIV